MALDLKAEREKRGYSIEQVCKILKIRKQYIIAIEENDYHNTPGEAYIRGYIKTYCDFLGVDIPAKKNPLPSEHKPIRYSINLNQKLMVLCSLLMLILTVVIYYFYFKN